MGAGGTPANPVVKSVGTGKYYADPVEWELDTRDNCTTGWGSGDYASPCSPIGECYDEEFSDDLTISGATTDATHFRRLTVAAGERHGGNYPKVDSGAKNTGYVNVSEDYAEVWWLIVDSATMSNSSQIDVSGGQDVLIRNMIAEAGTSQYIVFRAAPGNALDTVLENCIGINRRENTAARVFAAGYQDGVKYRNCTAWARASTTIPAGFIYGEPTNCIGINGSGADAYQNMEGSGDWNVGSDTSAPGSNSDQYDNTAAADLFKDTTDGAEDLRLKDDADGNFEGTDLSAYFEDDIDGDPAARADWDIGADEYPSAPPTGIIVNRTIAIQHAA